MIWKVVARPLEYSGLLCVCVALVLLSSVHSADFPQRIKRQVKTSDNTSDGYPNDNACSSNYTLRPQHERQCDDMPHFSCQFGICETIHQMGFIELSCMCDNGAVGPMCEFTCCLTCVHGTCNVYSNGTEYCKCNAEYYGMFCEIEREAQAAPRLETTISPSLGNEYPESHACSSNYTMKAVDKRQCNKHLICVYGHCDIEEHEDFREFSCLCDEGSHGQRCESKCCLNCVHGICALFPNHTEYCNCRPGFTGTLCEHAAEPITTPDMIDISITTVKSVSNNVSSNNSCSANYTLRSLEQRVCVPNKLTCVYGLCERTIQDDFLNFDCVCDKGAYGTQCDRQCCDLNCEHGDCYQVGDSPVYCRCYVGYTGDSCEISSPTIMVETISDNFSLNDSCSANYTLRPLEQRICVSNKFTCLYGICEKTIEDDLLHFSCSCDKRAYGRLCDRQCCDLNCEHGYCDQLDDSPAYCKCHVGYIGSSCEIHSPIIKEETISDNFSLNHSCSANYTLRSLEQRACAENNKLTCVYGLCERMIVDDELNHACVCDKGAYGIKCDKLCCDLNCEHGNCTQIMGSPVYCKCDHRYNGTSCEFLITDTVTTGQKKDTWYLWVVGVCSGVLGLLILALVIIPYWMWHNRVTVIMKIVHYFQPYEDDDERTWDAFVSYKSADVDQNFVLHTLFPKLEKELGFKLCMHFRDFMPGDTIANNIINAVNNSRRTILILTPRYIESEFTRFEYQVAQHEMLKRKHRIIPILLEDISDSLGSMDPNLRQIIRSVTYIEYPGADAAEKKLNTFWKRMTLSMPKTRSTEEHQKQLENNNKECDSNGVNVISINGELSVSNNKTETEMTSFTNGGINSTEHSEISVQIIEEDTVACKNSKNDNNGELYNKAYIS